MSEFWGEPGKSEKLWHKVKNSLSCGDQQTPKSDRSTKRIQDHLENSQNIRRLSRPSRSFPSHKKLSRSTRNFLNSTESFRPCGDFLNGPETFQCNIKVTRKNFPELQKLSSWHCQPDFWVSADQFRLSRRVGLGLWLGPTSTQGGPVHKSWDTRCTNPTDDQCPSLGKVFSLPKFNLLKLSFAM